MTSPPTDRVRGVVKFWKPDKGWGALGSDALPAGRDAFAHFSVLELDGSRELVEGQAVDFTYEPTRQDSFEFVATWVKPVG